MRKPWLWLLIMLSTVAALVALSRPRAVTIPDNGGWSLLPATRDARLVPLGRVSYGQLLVVRDLSHRLSLVMPERGELRPLSQGWDRLEVAERLDADHVLLSDGDYLSVIRLSTGESHRLTGYNLIARSGRR